MKKFFALFVCVAFAQAMFSQVVIREGNTYVVDNQMMKKQDFATYMQQNAEQQLSMRFANGLRLSKVGWGLFGAGVGMGFAGGVTMVAYSASLASKETDPVVTGPLYAGNAMMIVGNLLTIPGIVCLGVGYGRMHNAADCYSAVCNAKRQTAYLTVNADQNGLGLALHF